MKGITCSSPTSGSAPPACAIIIWCAGFSRTIRQREETARSLRPSEPPPRRPTRSAATCERIGRDRRDQKGSEGLRRTEKEADEDRKQSDGIGRSQKQEEGGRGELSATCVMFSALPSQRVERAEAACFCARSLAAPSSWHSVGIEPAPAIDTCRRRFDHRRSPQITGDRHV